MTDGQADGNGLASTAVRMASPADRCKNEIIFVSVSKTKKTYVFSAIVFRCSRRNISIFICYLCSTFYLKNVEKIRKHNVKM